MKYKFASHFIIFSVLLALMFSAPGVTPARAAGRCYVNDDAPGANTGASWTDAYTSLQFALGDPCTEIWVAAGTYKPTTGSDRTATFQLENGVAIYGGFDGVDDAALADRDPAANVTILSGDIETVANTDNSYHVVTGASNATLDGFTITGGYANETSSNNSGGGILNSSVSNATFSNLIIKDNYASAAGGGVDNHSSTVTFTNITVTNNSTPSGSYGGGGMFNWTSNSIVTNATFVGNSSTYGGGMYNDWSSPTLTNVTFTSNSASSNGGGIYNNNSSNAVIRNAIVWGNGTQIINAGSSSPSVTYSVVQGGYSGTGNLSTDPKLGTLGNYGGYTQTIPLLAGSSALDAGNNCASTDQRGISRPQPAGGQCDIGAYELQFFAVTYNANGATGGSVPVNQTKTYGVDLTLATNSGSLVKTNYTFNGWNTLANGTGTHYAIGGTYAANSAATLYAEWLPKPSLTLTSATSNPTSVSPIPLAIAFDQPVSGLSVSDFAVSNGTASNLTSLGVGVSPLYTQVSAGVYHTCGLASDGSLRCWGENSFDQTTVPTLSSGLNYTAVSAGGYHTCGLVSDGSLQCWGWNDYGQTIVPALSGGLTYTAVSTGYKHTCGLASDGSLRCWGYNAQGQTTVPTLGGGLTYTAVSTGYEHTCSLASDGSLRCWGSIDTGQTIVPVLSGGLTYTGVSAGDYHTCGLVSDGSLRCWGYSADGQTTVPALSSGLTYTAVSAGGSHTCGLVSSGSLRCWGRHDYNQNIVPYLGGGLTYTAVSAGGSHNCGRVSNGSLRCWGWNDDGQTTVPALPPYYATYTAEIIPTAGGPVTVDMPVDSVRNLAGNGNTAATQFSITYAPTYAIAYNANGATGGSVPVNQTKTYGVDLTLAANTGSLVKTGYTFNGWNTLANGTGTHFAASGIYTANAAATLYAEWTLNSYTLTYTAGDHGSITGTSPQTVNHGADGSQVTAVPDANYHFVSWSDGVLTASRTDTNVTDDITVTANFVQDAYTLTVNSAHGTVTKTPDQATYHYGDVVTLSVTPEAGWTFTGWTPSLTDNRVTITGNTTVTANFTQDEYTLTVNSAHGTVTRTPDQPTYHYGDVVTLSIAPEAGWTFTGWTPSLTSNQVTITGNTTVTANFTQDEYTLTVNSEHGTVTKSPDQPTYHYGDVVTLSVTPEAGWTFTGWTPALTDNQVTITGNTTVTANYREIPVITWANPANITYGTALSVTQLNATANTPGTFTYTPASGAILTVGTHTLHVDFTPTDTVNYANASKDVSITVTQAGTVITWSNPANITYGTPLSATQLNATANTPGVFTYTPASGTVLNVGTHTLHVDFVPTDTTNYANASKDVSITITQTATVLTWADPADIEYGTALSATQLNATANVPGAFTYTPAAGTYLAVGTHTLHVDFVPTDTTNYANASKEVSLTVIDHVLFADVPDGYWARPFIERLYLKQITGGCANNPLRYCPSTNVNRAMMAVFVLRAAHGSDFTPPTATGTVFADVPADGFAAAWIEQLAAEGITGGCGGGNYCPTKPVTRAQMAVFLVKAMYGTAYVPPTASGAIFGDVPADGFAAAFIEQLVADGITGGCGGGNFCPNKYITRAEMAVFLVAAFNLP
jgi:uncharacterized repeat protein (TIGR02543 family)